jgi:hypothetical protein
VNITVLVTCTVTAVVVAYTSVRCRCGRRIMDVPGEVLPEVRVLAKEAHPSGRGRTVRCKCGGVCEVIEHRKAA